jgi:hypothetical protein
MTKRRRSELSELRSTLPWQVIQIFEALGVVRDPDYLVDAHRLQQVFSRRGFALTQAMVEAEQAFGGLCLGAGMRTAFTPSGADHSSWFAIADDHRIGAFASLCRSAPPDEIIDAREPERLRPEPLVSNEDSVTFVARCNPEVRLGGSGRVYFVCMNDMDTVEYASLVADSAARYLEMLALLRTAMFWPPSEMDPLRWHLVYSGQRCGSVLANGLGAEQSSVEDTRSSVWYRGTTSIVEQRVAGFADSTKVSATSSDTAVDVVRSALAAGISVSWWCPGQMDVRALGGVESPTHVRQRHGYSVLSWGEPREDDYEYGRQQTYWRSLRTVDRDRARKSGA